MNTPKPELPVVAYLKTWNSVGGTVVGRKRVDLTDGHEAWLKNMFPVVEPLCKVSDAIAAIEATEQGKRQVGDVKGAGFIQKTNIEYAAWCGTYYQADALDERGMASLHGLWAWQAATVAAQRQPLRGEQIHAIFLKALPKQMLGMDYVPEWAIPVARAIEAAHGITAATPQGKI